MALAGCTVTGLNEMRAGVRQLPSAVTARLRVVANATAQRVLARARENLRRQTRGTGALAAAIRVQEDASARQVEVISTAPQTRVVNGAVVRPPLNVPIWVEFGTRHMAARPYMGPALWDESARYVAESRAAAEACAEEALG